MNGSTHRRSRRMSSLEWWRPLRIVHAPCPPPVSGSQQMGRGAPSASSNSVARMPTVYRPQHMSSLEWWRLLRIMHTPFPPHVLESRQDGSRSPKCVVEFRCPHAHPVLATAHVIVGVVVTPSNRAYAMPPACFGISADGSRRPKCVVEFRCPHAHPV